jgi:DNA uptake protein ComE-like DNA-binding protein
MIPARITALALSVALPVLLATAATQGVLLDPNTATHEQLIAVPGVAGHVADAIVAGRPYADMRAVNKVLVTHVPDSVARKTIYEHVWKPIDLNTASDEEILLIPGVGRRMLHEFKEYRPYKIMDQFIIQADEDLR